MAEQGRIARYFAPLTRGEAGSFSLTDDAAVIAPPAGSSLVVTTDSVIEAIHVLPGATPQQFAQKLIRRNLSDLAAMGARPWRYTLNMHTPHGDNEQWVAAFAAALAEEQQAFGLTLIGGDSTSGGAHRQVTMTCFGLLRGAPLLRSTAQVGDDIYVSGTIGDAALGLRVLQQGLGGYPTLVERYHRPTPRLALGEALQGMATAAIDISDGLLADLAQLCRASNLGADIVRAQVKLSSEAQQMLAQDDACWKTILTGGDDYELLFTAPASARGALAALEKKLGLPLTRIGTVTQEAEVMMRDDQRNPVTYDTLGFEHR